MLTQAEKNQWLTELRSGEIKQCFGTFAWAHTPQFRGRHLCTLSVDVRRENFAFCAIGVLGYIVGHRDATDCAYEPIVAMNDQERKSFSEIADWIEANVEASP